jgi:hypothetical protein
MRVYFSAAQPFPTTSFLTTSFLTSGGAESKAPVARVS